MKNGFGFRPTIGGGGWWLLVLCWLTATPVRADHLIGYDWGFEPVGVGSFRARLTLYLDPTAASAASNGDPSVTIAAYERSTSARLMGTFTLPRTSSALLPGGAGGCAATQVLIRAVVYEQVLTLPAALYNSPNGYWLTWERCCRNAGLTNLLNPTSEGTAMLMAFPRVGSGAGGQAENHSPAFARLPVAQALCVGESVAISFSAVDRDADSLSYSLVPALAGFTSQGSPVLSVPNPPPFPSVNYAAGYSGQQPLPGNFTLDPRTGQLLGTPTQPGIFTVLVRVEEWRRRQKIGENRREIQLTVRGCRPNQAPTISTLPGTPDTIVITNQNPCFRLRVADADAGQTLTVRALGNAPVIIDPALLSGGSADTITICRATCPAPGFQVLTLLVQDDGCPTATDTLQLPVRVVSGIPNHPPVIDRVPAGASDTLKVWTGETLAFELLATDADQDDLQVQVVTAPVGLTVAPVQGTGTLRTQVRWAIPCDARVAGYYELWFRVRDGRCGTTDSVRVPVRVEAVAATGLLPPLPNIITPDGDGINDCLSLPVGLPAGPCNGFDGIEVFNRWGRKVYVSSDMHFCWDGAEVPAGTYFLLLHWNNRTWRQILTVIH